MEPNANGLPLPQACQRSYHLRELEVLNDIPAPCFVMDFTPNKTRMVWGNFQCLSMYKCTLEEFQAKDLITETTEAVKVWQESIYATVQVELKCDCHRKIVYPDGNKMVLDNFFRPLSLIEDEDFKPSAPQAPNSEAGAEGPRAQTLALIFGRRVDTMGEDETFKTAQTAAALSHELLLHTDILALVFDKDGNNIYQNHKAKEFYGVSSLSGITLKLLLDLAHWEGGESQKQGYLRQLQSLSPLEPPAVAEVCRPKGDQVAWYRIVCKSIPDPGSGIESLMVCEYDITEQKANEAAVQRRKEEQSVFFAGLSHELRAPLNGIIGLSDSLLTDPNCSPNMTKALSAIKSSGHRLAGLVNDILDSAAKEHNTLVLRQDTLSLHEIVESVCEIISPMVPRGVELRNEIDPEIVEMDGDPVRINQIFTNLLSNAVKFTKSGSITIRAERPDADHIQVKVVDTGIGIKSEKLESIWGAFKQAETSTAKQYGGTGLGLTLVKTLVEAHNAEISVSSSAQPPDQGTTFTMVFPVRQGANAEGAGHPVLRGPSSDSTGINGSASGSLTPSSPQARLSIKFRGGAERIGSGTQMSDGVRSEGSRSQVDEELEKCRCKCAAMEQQVKDLELEVTQLQDQLQSQESMCKELQSKLSKLRPQNPKPSSPSGVRSFGGLSGKMHGGSTGPHSPSPPGSPGLKIQKPVSFAQMHRDGKGPGAFSESDKQLIERLHPDDKPDLSEVVCNNQVNGSYEILSVDDDPVNQMVIENFVTTFGFTATTCMDGIEALKLLESRDYLPDLVLLDVMMPQISGIEVCERLRQRYPRAALPVIMISANSGEGNIVQGLEAGANDYISKPFSRLELLARIQTQINLKEAFFMEVEHAQVKELLSSILPAHVISRLKKERKMFAESHDAVSILFSDIVDYTSLAASIPTITLIEMLSQLFTKFDELCDKHGTYKVETIGDSYMVVAGHDGNKDHARVLADMAMDMLEVVKEIARPDGKERHIKVRIGIHSGPAHAGVVGTKVPRYCFFGDTVNTASRMESHGFPMCIHVSEPCKLELDRFFDFVSLGERSIKGKGVMETFILQDSSSEWRQALEIMKSTAKSGDKALEPATSGMRRPRASLDPSTPELLNPKAMDSSVPCPNCETSLRREREAMETLSKLRTDHRTLIVSCNQLLAHHMSVVSKGGENKRASVSGSEGPRSMISEGTGLLGADGLKGGTTDSLRSIGETIGAEQVGADALRAEEFRFPPADQLLEYSMGADEPTAEELSRWEGGWDVSADRVESADAQRLYEAEKAGRLPQPPAPQQSAAQLSATQHHQQAPETYPTSAPHTQGLPHFQHPNYTLQPPPPISPADAQALFAPRPAHDMALGADRLSGHGSGLSAERFNGQGVEGLDFEIQQLMLQRDLTSHRLVEALLRQQSPQSLGPSALSPPVQASRVPAWGAKGQRAEPRAEGLNGHPQYRLQGHEVAHGSEEYDEPSAHHPLAPHHSAPQHPAYAATSHSAYSSPHLPPYSAPQPHAYSNAHPPGYPPGQHHQHPSPQLSAPQSFHSPYSSAPQPSAPYPQPPAHSAAHSPYPHPSAPSHLPPGPSHYGPSNPQPPYPSAANPHTRSAHSTQHAAPSEAQAAALRVEGLLRGWQAEHSALSAQYSALSSQVPQPLAHSSPQPFNPYGPQHGPLGYPPQPVNPHA